MFRVGDFARLAQVSVRLLHYYDHIGLLQPLQVDPVTGYRYYAIEQLPRLHRILALKDLGLSLGQITYLLNESVTNNEIRGILLLKQAELRDRVEEEQGRLARVEARLHYLEPSASLSEPEIVVKRVEPMNLLTIRRAIPFGQSPAALMREAYCVLRDANLWQHVTTTSCFYHTAFVCHRYPHVVPRRALVEAAYAIEHAHIRILPRVRNRQMRVYTTPNYDHVLSAIHIGPDSTRHLAFQAIWGWVARNSVRLAAPPREIYLQRGKSDRPEDNITEIQFPLQKIERD